MACSHGDRNQGNCALPWWLPVPWLLCPPGVTLFQALPHAGPLQLSWLLKLLLALCPVGKQPGGQPVARGPRMAQPALSSGPSL